MGEKNWGSSGDQNRIRGFIRGIKKAGGQKIQGGRNLWGIKNIRGEWGQKVGHTEI